MEQILDTALNLQLSLSETADSYDLPYIGEHLAKCSSYHEKLNDLSMELTRFTVEIIKAASSARAMLENSEQELREGEEYKNMDRQEKGNWLKGQLRSLVDESEGWASLKRMVSVVQEAVSERAQTMKRLDSALRLQTRLYEAQNGPQGPTPRPSGFPGASGGGMDI